MTMTAKAIITKTIMYVLAAVDNDDDDDDDDDCDDDDEGSWPKLGALL